MADLVEPAARQGDLPRGLDDRAKLHGESLCEAHDGGLPILDGTCYMHRQANFYAANFPEGTKVAEDGEAYAFPLPPIDASKPDSILVGAEFVAAFNDRPEVQAFQAYLSSPEWANEKGKATPQGGWLSAHTGLDPANIASPIDKLSVQILQDKSKSFSFDGSDLMPAQVGSKSFWTGMTDWINGTKDTKQTLDFIESTWPK